MWNVCTSMSGLRILNIKAGAECKKQRGGEEMLGQSRAEMEQSIGRQELEKEKSCRVWWMLQTLIYELQDRGLWELGGEIIAIFAT